MECQIPANSDVAGIGVRVSIYFQALFAIVSAYIRYKASGETLSEEMLRSTFISSMTIILTGLAIAISGVIQAGTYGLSVYHALLLLDLCWVILIGALVPFCITIWTKEIEGHARHLAYWDRHFGLSGWGDQDPFIRFPSRLHLLHSLHFTVVSCVGIWVFSRIRSFDTSPDNCTLSTVAVVLGHKIFAIAKVYCTFSLSLYSLLAVPILNVILVLTVFSFLTAVAFIPLGFINNLMTGDMSIESPSVVLWAPLVAIIMVISSTEQTIRANNIAPGEGQWTLGQTLALMAAFISTIDFDLWLWRRIFPRSNCSNIDDEERSKTPSLQEMQENLPYEELKAAWKAWDAHQKAD